MIKTKKIDFVFIITVFIIKYQIFTMSDSIDNKCNDKDKIIDEFLCGDCTLESCGHKTHDRTLSWVGYEDFDCGITQEVIWSIPPKNKPWDKGEEFFEIKLKTKLCLFCFTYGLSKYVKRNQKAPISFYEGGDLYNIIEYIRIEIQYNPNLYFEFINSEEYEIFKNLEFDNNEYIVDESNNFKFTFLFLIVFILINLIKLKQYIV